MIRETDLESWLQLAPASLVIDVRSESEYTHAHIPGSVNIPVLNDEQRKIIGTIYKQEGKEAAILKGFELAGPFFFEKMKKVLELYQQGPVLVYCWRGGLRSNIFSWLISFFQFDVLKLPGGYKAFRNYALDIITQKREVFILGGKTGSGKTEMLHQLKDKGIQIIDLEALANHKGSAFGALGLDPQPSTEHFENLLAWELFGMDASKPLWLENESRMIGGVKIPDPFYNIMRSAPVLDIQIPFSRRVERIMHEYGKFSVKEICETTWKLKKRLGDKLCREAANAFEQGDTARWAEILLAYYDKFYEYGNSTRDPESIVAAEIKNGDDIFYWVEQIMDKYAEYKR